MRGEAMGTMEGLRAIPVLPARDIPEALAFYGQHLDLVGQQVDPDYGIAAAGAVAIHFWRCADRAVAEQSSCRIMVRAIEPLYGRHLKAGIVHPHAPLETKPWGTREFAIIDPSGNAIWFCEEGGTGS